MSKIYKPGQIAPRSGEYEIRGPRGGHTGKERTVVKGEPFPPTRQSNERYSLSRAAHNNAGRSSKR
jgi:hypothetical protein